METQTFTTISTEDRFVLDVSINDQKWKFAKTGNTAVLEYSDSENYELSQLPPSFTLNEALEIVETMVNESLDVEWVDDDDDDDDDDDW